MKVCFVGLGSIGIRHLKNLIEIFEETNQDYIIDAYRETQNKIEPTVHRYINNEFYNIADLPNDYDIAFITNPTAMHFDTILAVQDKAKNFFIEKPVFDKTTYDLSKFKTHEQFYYVACPLRYTNVIQFLKEILYNKKVYSARVICSSYLPEWRNGVDYSKTYSARKDLGGGVSIDLIHEWDYLVYLFGKPENISKMEGKISDLNINSEDIAIYLARYADKLLSIHLDYFGRVPRREIEIYTDEEVIVGDLIQSKIRFLKEDKEIDLSQSRDEYQKKELRYFLSMINGDAENINSIHSAVEILKIAKDEREA